MTITRLQAGPRMSQAVVHGATIYLAGQVADQAKGKSVGEQTTEILAKIDGLLAEAGSDKTRILSATIYLADIATFAEMNAAWEAWVPPAMRPPARPSRPSSPRRLYRRNRLHRGQDVKADGRVRPPSRRPLRCLSRRSTTSGVRSSG